jgi:hypothetical protein
MASTTAGYSFVASNRVLRKEIYGETIEPIKQHHSYEMRQSRSGDD